MNISSTASMSLQKKIVLGTGAVAVALAIAFFLQTPPVEIQKNGIPIPFASEGSALQGAVTLMGKRNGIDVYEVTYKNGERSETLFPDRIYLVHIPNNIQEILDVSLDVAMTSAISGARDVDYYGYRYADATATIERKDFSAILFKNRFPAQFFASEKAVANDAQNGNQLAAFALQNDITFRKTDGSAQGVRIDPLGGLYVFIVNETGGATLFARHGGICGNGVLEPGEECDDGDSNNANLCSNTCKNTIPIPFDETSAGTGARLALSVQTVASFGTAHAGQTGVTLLRFYAAAAEAARLTKVITIAQTGSLSDAVNYRLVVDTNNDGRVDTVVRSGVTPASGLLTFDAINGVNGQLIGTANAVVFEVIADIASAPTGKYLEINIAKTTSSYVTGRRESPAVALAGIRTDGVCSENVCQISVITRPSILWTIFVPPTGKCGNGVVEGSEACDDGDRIDTDSCSNSCTVQSTGVACLLVDLDAYWKFDENGGARADAMNTYTLSIEGDSSVLGSATGKILKAVAATQGTLLQDENPVLTNPNRNFTVAQWLFLPSANIGSGLMTYALKAGADILWYLGYDTWQSNTYFMSIGNEKLSLSGVQKGAWNFLVGSYDATTRQLSLSMNAEIPVTKILSGTLLVTGAGVNKFVTVNALGNDLFDESGIWNRVLTQQEIGALYNNGNALPFDAFATSCVAAPICGNSVIESGETCDDGNTANGDGCSALCQSE